MMEPLFGTAGPPWTGVPAAGGWSSPIGNRQILNTPLGIPQFGPAINGQFGSAPLGTAVLPPDLIAALNVPALLAAVAMRRGQPLGPTTDQEIEDFVYDALELLPGTSEVELRCEGSRVTFTGSVLHKRLKRDIGEIGWAIPNVADVQNNVTITTRRRARNDRREAEAQAQHLAPKPKEQR
jgi:hypothetical protein